MDRCRCEDYAAAVSKLKFYTVGTLRPDIIDNYDGSGYKVSWIRHGVDSEDLKFEKPKVLAIRELQMTENQLSDESRKIEQMWCPYMNSISR
ncbi:unnamed protein product [Parnassius mnemosyne]|uniref:Uncharacterized protein n=1 Tax=Parnassius mnemosyne TaxID=213953 RepID=A0AAV1L5L8_9NEOP